MQKGAMQTLILSVVRQTRMMYVQNYTFHFLFLAQPQVATLHRVILIFFTQQNILIDVNSTVYLHHVNGILVHR